MTVACPLAVAFVIATEQRDNVGVGAQAISPVTK